MIPEDDEKSGLQAIKNLPDREEQLRRISLQYIPVGEKRLTEARAHRLALIGQLRDEGVPWRRMTELSGLSEQYMRRALEDIQKN